MKINNNERKYLIITNENPTSSFLIEGWLVASQEEQIKAKEAIDTVLSVKKTVEQKTEALKKELSSLNKKSKKLLFSEKTFSDYHLLKSNASSITAQIQEYNRYSVLKQDIEFYIKDNKKFSNWELELIKTLSEKDSVDFNIEHSFFSMGLLHSFSSTDIPEEKKQEALKAYLVLSAPTVNISWDIL